MPKPSFFQSVLRKPTRSYADPNAPSPWADPYPQSGSETYYDPPSRYVSQVDQGVHLGYRERDRYDQFGRGREARDGSEEAGPSRPRRTAKSTVSVQSDVPRPTSSMSTRFPKAARKVNSTVELRETRIVQIPHDDEPRSSRSGTVKKKKVKPKASVHPELPKQPSRVAPTSTGGRASKQAYQGDDDDSSLVSSPSVTQPPPLRPFVESDTSSSRSSPVPPISPAVSPDPQQYGTSETRKHGQSRPAASVLQKAVFGRGVAPITPPSSDGSLVTATKQLGGTGKPPVPSSREDHRNDVQASVPPARRVVIVEDPQEELSSHSESESSHEEFFTPRQSMNDPVRVTEAQPARVVHVAPIVSIQPPTPAPIPDPLHSPFHQDSPTQDHAQSPLSRPTQPVDSPVFEDDDESVQPEVGSDEEAERTGRPSSRATISRRTSSSQPSRPPSRAQSTDLLRATRSPTSSHSGESPRRARTEGTASIDGSVSRHSTAKRSSTSRKSFSEFIVHRRGSMQVSERSFGGKSDSNRNSGYGKGGWAAAAAQAPSRSGASTPVMYMPTGQNDGWANFQVPTGPPRQSRFTPLPPASQPPTFNGLLTGERYGSSVRTAEDDEDDSSLSEYSKLSDGAPMPQPSRSYANFTGQSASRDSKSDLSQTSGPVVDPHEIYRRLSEGAGQSPHLQEAVSSPDDSRSTSPSQLQHGSSDDVVSSKPAGCDSVPPPRAPSSIEAYTSPSQCPLQQRPLSPQPSSLSRLAHETYQPPSRPMSPPLLTGPHIARSIGSPTFRPDSPARLASPTFGDIDPTQSRPMSPNPLSPDTRPPSATPRGFDAPSFLDPDTLTLLPEMTTEDSHRTYLPDPQGDAQRRNAAIRRSRSVFGDSAKSARTGSDDEDEVPDLPSRRSKSALGHRKDKDRDISHKWEGSSAGEGVLMESNGLDQGTGGYTDLILPSGAYRPSHPSKKSVDLEMRALGLPHATMASLTLSSSTHRLRSDTPMHLRAHLPAPVDFSSHLKPPVKVSDAQILVQVYAVAVDMVDSKALDDKGRSDVGKWVPGRSFVGRCLLAGAAEKEIVRGDLVMGLLDVRKVSCDQCYTGQLPSSSSRANRQSGALSEYLVCDRRRVARTPYPTNLTLEQMALLPLQGIAAIRAIRARLIRHTRALICDAHEGIQALMCQELSRASVHVTALISGGEDHHSAQSMCMAHGARGVLTGKPAAVMNGLDEGWDLIVETQGGQNAYDAARRILKDGGK